MQADAGTAGTDGAGEHAQESEAFAETCEPVTGANFTGESCVEPWCELKTESDAAGACAGTCEAKADENTAGTDTAAGRVKTEADAAETAKDEAHEAMNRACDEAFERGKIAGLQEAILAIMEKNGNVTDRMRQDVYDNVYHDSLINWVKSFR